MPSVSQCFFHFSLSSESTPICSSGGVRKQGYSILFATGKRICHESSIVPSCSRHIEILCHLGQPFSQVLLVLPSFLPAFIAPSSRVQTFLCSSLLFLLFIGLSNCFSNSKAYVEIFLHFLVFLIKFSAFFMLSFQFVLKLLLLTNQYSIFLVLEFRSLAQNFQINFHPKMSSFYVRISEPLVMVSSHCFMKFPF